MDLSCWAALPEPEIACHIQALARSGDAATLLALLREEHPAWCGRGATAVQRIRGALLLALAQGGRLSDAALLPVLEELDNGRSAFTVVAAAAALRTGAQPSPAHIGALVQALSNLRDHNDYVDLAVWGGVADAASVTTARLHVLQTLQAWGAPTQQALERFRAWLARDGTGLTPEEADASHALLEAWSQPEAKVACCEAGIDFGAVRSWLRGQAPRLDEVAFEDQDGRAWRFDDVFKGQPSIVVFFYTRCDNPDKCALTLSKLAALQRRLRAENFAAQLRTTAITYDPDYDLAPRLQAHAHSRGLVLDDCHRVLRAVRGWDALRRHFELGVNYVGTLVNRHRIEAYLVDGQGHIRVSFERLRWDEDVLLHQAKALLDEAPTAGTQPTAPRPKWLNASAPVLALALALMPKCPICGLSYLSLTGLIVLPTLPGPYAWMPVLLLLMLANVAGLWWLGRRQSYRAGLGWTVAGTAVSILAGLGLQLDSALWSGLALVVAGSVSTLWRMRQPRPIS